MNKKDNPFINCRSWLFAPASNPKLLYNAPVYKPDAIVFDLEDAVALKEKEDARELLIEAFKSINYGNIPIFARINSIKTPFGFDDIKYLVELIFKIYYVYFLNVSIFLFDKLVYSYSLRVNYKYFNKEFI